MHRRSLLLLPLLGVVSACAGPAPRRAALEADLLQRIKITGVNVDVSSLSSIRGGRRPVTAQDVKAAVEKEAKPRLVGLGGGTQQATAVIRLTSVDLMTAAQAYLIGGESVVRGTVSVVDNGSGQTLMAPENVSSGGGGWVLGGVMGVLTMDDTDVEIQQLSAEFANRAATLIGTG